MSGRIPEQFIDDLLTRINIIDVINDHVPLKRAGANYTARCPFHEERTPSFTVSPDKQFYHCFGCGAHGSAIGFLMAYEHMNFVEAIQELATRAGLTVPQVDSLKRTSGGEKSVDLTELFNILQLAQEFFQLQLRENPQGSKAVDYLKGRGINGTVARDFGLGLAPSGWDNLVKYLSEKSFSTESLIACGLATARENSSGAYDRFRDRIMFPIRDHRGRTIGFGGRVLDDSTPKYLNSPETVLFHKGKELYGLFEARRAQRDLDRLIVVEGYMDVIALAQHGLTNSVATLGTAATAHHLEKLYRIVPEVIFCFDGDNAGYQAAWRALQHALTAMRDGRQAKFMFLPDGDDPDSYIRRVGAEVFENEWRAAPTLSQFFWKFLEAKTDMTTLDGRARLAELVRPFLSTIPEGVFKDMMMQELSVRTGLDPSKLLKPPHEQRSTAMATRADSTRTPPERAMGLSPLRTALALLVNDPALACTPSEVPKIPDSVNPGLILLKQLIDFCRSRPHLTTGALLELWRDRPEYSYLEKIAKWQILTPKDGQYVEFLGALNKIHIAGLERLTDSLLSKPLDALSPDERQQLRELTANLAASKRSIEH